MTPTEDNLCQADDLASGDAVSSPTAPLHPGNSADAYYENLLSELESSDHHYSNGTPADWEAAKAIRYLRAENARLREALAPIKWLTDLHEQSRHGKDDPDTTSIMVALGILRRARDANTGA